MTYFTYSISEHHVFKIKFLIRTILFAFGLKYNKFTHSKVIVFMS